MFRLRLKNPSDSTHVIINIIIILPCWNLYFSYKQKYELFKTKNCLSIA